METDVVAGPDHRQLEAHIPEQNRDLAAFWLATYIALRRCGGAPQYFNAWLTRWAGGPAHDPVLHDSLLAFLGSESIGTETQPAAADHLEGFVAEHVWHALTTEGASGFVQPLRVDGPDWSVKDSGGDGLSIHRWNGALVFRLWESKGHSSDGEVRQVVNGACRQLSANALRYLARFSQIGQHLDDDELRLFYGRLVEHWRTGAQEGGGGVAVTTTHTAPVDDCFGNFSSYWDFDHLEQRHGIVVVVESYSAFAASVREHLWKGL